MTPEILNLLFPDRLPSIKEIEKLYRKHHRLMGYEKKTKVVQSLMRKGFSYDDISTVYERICEELEDE